MGKMKLQSIRFAQFVTTALIIAAVSGCTQSHQKVNTLPLIKDASEIISTRPQNTAQFMAVVKLKTPALLSTAQVVADVRSIDQALLKKINEEQEIAISEMKKLSVDVGVLFRYKMVLNAVAVVGPKEVFEKLSAIGLIASWEKVGTFERPRNMNTEQVKSSTTLSERNALKFLGAEKLHQLGITGRGMSVGVIDTGIDYTHAMFGGVGTVDGYTAIDPSKEAVGYPSAKVVGGVDLVGTLYDTGSPEFAHTIPRPDMNPLDEGGHGTHVAGSIAGIGDGLNSYDGMAKDASLHAIKVFGANGSTSDMVVIAGLEYAADPNGDGDLRDQLDVVNLSLGSGYGNPKILYAEAVKNLVQGGTVAVISAGNSGNVDYIVGAPGTSTEALSVAASIDNGDHNWKYDAAEIVLPNETIGVEVIEAVSTKPVSESNVSGDFYFIGFADKELTEEQKILLKGKVALIDRGVVSFNDKIKLASAAGAIGVVVMNNKNEPSFKMGTTDTFPIPAIMVTQAIGNKIKEALKLSVIRINYNSQLKIEKPELVDTITDFSSKGPRSIDGYLKPEISSPGSDIISAEMGGGSKVVKMSGTSMAAPNAAGVLTLIKQSMKQRGLNLTALELKNIAMGTAKTISEKGVRYPVSRQGSGRIQADVAAEALVVANEPSISFGEITIESKKSVRSKIEIKNLTKSDLNLSVVFEGNEFISMVAVSDLNLKSEANQAFNLIFNLDSTKMSTATVREMDGWVKLMKGTVEVYRIPVLAVAHKLSSIAAVDLVVMSNKSDSAGAAASVQISNGNQNAGDALLFNLLSKDDRKPLSSVSMNADCDLQSVGYKIINKTNEKDELIQVVQFGIKTYKPMTTWNACDVSILFDENDDGIPEQELLGATASSIPGQKTDEFASTLLDAEVARQIRHDFEVAVEKVKNDPEAVAKLKGLENYSDAVRDQREMLVFNNSTVLVIEAELSKLIKNKNGELQIQVVVTHNEQSTVQMDDYLANSQAETLKISANIQDQPFLDLGEVLKFSPEEIKTVDLTTGEKSGQILALYPQNKFTFSDNIFDAQSQILKPIFSSK